MRKINLNEIKEEPWQSPGGKYAVSFKGISEALGREPASLDLAKRHPFDLEWNRVPPGKCNYPYHAHSTQWELYLVVSGKGTFVTKMAQPRSSLATLLFSALTSRTSSVIRGPTISSSM